MSTGFNFAYKKATQALNFFAIQNGGEIDKLHALKLVFFADRYHLRKYGRPITNDQYWAMNFGPVPSGVKDIFELDSASSIERHYAEEFFEKGSKPYSICSKANVDNNVISDSDQEALSFAWNTFGCHSGIVEKTHEYPEWKRHEATLESGCSRVQMDYMDFIENPDEPVNPCHPLSIEEQEDLRDHLKEMSDVISLWR